MGVASRRLKKVEGGSTSGTRRWLLGVGTIAALIAVGCVVLARVWPFTEAKVIEELERATSSTVQIAHFSRTFFPRPGCVAEGVQFRRGSDPRNQAVLTVERLTIEGNLGGLFTKHLALIRADGAHASFPPFGTGPDWKPTASDVVVDELIADNATLDFVQQDRQKSPVKFTVHELRAHHLATPDPMKFELRLKNPQPPGEVEASGSFGPWKMDQVHATPITGNYSFRNADLGAFRGIGGILSSAGQFDGTLDSIEIHGTTSTPDFGVKGGTHKVGLSSKFHAQVDATNGDVTLDDVSARLLGTTVWSRGTIAVHRNEDGKRAELDLAVRNGRIQDLLLLFVSEKEAPLHGTISLKAKTIVPPGPKPFLEKLQMTGDFGIESASFTKDTTQEDVDKLSAAGLGEGDRADSPENVVSDLKGQVVVRDGVANFSDLSFAVPGARARLHGTFDLRNDKVDLRGTLYMDAKLPQATSGIKSFLLKGIDPFLKKNRRGGARIPITIGGTYQHPVYTSDPI